MQFSLFWSHSLFFSFSIYFLESHPALGCHLSEKDSKGATMRQKNKSDYMNCRTQKWLNRGLLDCPLVRILVLQIVVLSYLAFAVAKV